MSGSFFILCSNSTMKSIYSSVFFRETGIHNYFCIKWFSNFLHWYLESFNVLGIYDHLRDHIFQNFQPDRQNIQNPRRKVCFSDTSGHENVQKLSKTIGFALFTRDSLCKLQFCYALWLTTVSWIFNIFPNGLNIRRDLVF